MIDNVIIFVSAGDGGDGSFSLRRESHVPRGGPDGGDGGRGGNVVLRADNSWYSLAHIRNRQHFKAVAGGSGTASLKHGGRGEDVIVGVPLGTVVYPEATGDGEPIDEVVSHGDTLVLAAGGRGGRGNKHFATSVNRTPRFAEKGGKGEEESFRLELRLLADVALVGFPNAGKSTLLASATPAKVKIAGYPFTTIEPQLGVVEIDYERFVLVDIPGLLEGAAQGVGLGDEFLRHIQRTRVLIHLVSGESEDPLRDVQAVDAELAAFDPQLMRRPHILAVNKIDLAQVRDRTAELRDALASLKRPLFFISASTGEGVPQLMRAAFQAVGHAEDPRLPEPRQESYRVFRPQGEGGERVLRREDGSYALAGSGVPTLVAARDVGKGELALIVRERLRRTNWRRTLERAGVKAGDRIQVGEVQVDW